MGKVTMQNCKSVKLIKRHTPGPWIANGGYIRLDKCGTAFIRIMPKYGPVATDKEERKANARLIAAAPELLEACEKLFDVATKATEELTLACRCYATEDQDATMERARNIIAKARG